MCILTRSFKRETDKKKKVLKQRPAGGGKGGVEIEFFEMNVLVVCVKEGKDQKLLGDINLRADWIEPAGSPVGLGGKVSVQCKLLCAVLGAHKNLSHKILSSYALDEKKGRDRFFQMGSAVV